MKDLRSRFGMNATPFTREIEVDKRLRLDVFDHPLEALLRTVEQRMSAALVAPSGTGKTALLRALTSRLPEARYRVGYIKVTGLSKRDFCRELAWAIGCAPAGTYPMLVRRLQEHFLQTSDTDGLRSVLLIDEGHDLRPDVLGMLRLLTNFDMDSRLVVSIVLAGQAPLKTLLRRDNLEDVARRMTHYAVLRPLSREETNGYIQHRCAIAGAKTVPFDQGALDALYEIGRGNLRATDNLALKSLEISHMTDCDTANYNHVVESRKQLWP
jgi:general secretion pathway protein A